MRFVGRLVGVAAVLALGMSAAAQDAPKRTVALTFDDVPYTGATAEAPGQTVAIADAQFVNEAIRTMLVDQGVPATAFVTEQNVLTLEAEGARVVRRWVRSGLDLGNHGARHLDSNNLTLGEIETEIVQGEATISKLAAEFERPIHFYRFAYNHVGDTEEKRVAIEALLAEHDYRLAAATIDTSDYLFDAAFVRAGRERRADLRARIVEAYLTHTRAQVRYYAALNAEVLGYEPPAIMLLHANALNAEVMEDLLTIFREEGYDFVSLDEAMADAAYAASPRVATKFGPMWGYRWAKERGVTVDGSKEQEPPAWVGAYAKDGTVPAE